jgi:Oxidoreductase family, NAD-binding Rossmann fold/GFO/IDH/MocA C-terminal domain
MIRAIIVGGGARGNRVFADLMTRHDTGFTIAGVVEPVERKREAFCELYDVPAGRAFATLSDFLAAPKVADIVFICTLDPTHYEICTAVSEAGYDVLLEKPIATTLPDCLALLAAERRCRNRIFVAHGLRYAPFFRRIRDLLRAGTYGAVRHVSVMENVGHWHFAHSYVRGNWRRVDLCAPVILTKCSHDLDIIPWLVGERVAAVSSVGSLAYFRPENAPEGAADRCVDCGLRDTCRYSATRFYLREETGWPFETIVPPPDSLEARREAITTGPYGRCVWHSDNDVCDNQTVTLEFESGIHATLGMYALTADNTRKVTVLLDDAEITGDLYRRRLRVSPFTGLPHELAEHDIVLPDVDDRHGGGDLGLLRALSDHLRHGTESEIVSSLEASVLSHVLAFLAEDSRVAGGARLPVSYAFVPEPLMDS